MCPMASFAQTPSPRPVIPTGPVAKAATKKKAATDRSKAPKPATRKAQNCKKAEKRSKAMKEKGREEGGRGSRYGYLEFERPACVR